MTDKIASNWILFPPFTVCKILLIFSEGGHSRGTLFLFPPSARPCLLYIVYLPDTCTPASFGFSSETTEVSVSCFFCRWKPSTERWHCLTTAWTTPSVAPDTNCSSSRSQQQRQPPSLPRSSVLLFSPKKKCLNVSGGREEQASPS